MVDHDQALLIARTLRDADVDPSTPWAILAHAYLDLRTKGTDVDYAELAQADPGTSRIELTSATKTSCPHAHDGQHTWSPAAFGFPERQCQLCGVVSIPY